MKKLIFIFALLFSLQAEARIYIPIYEPAGEKMPIAITPLISLDGQNKKLKDYIPKLIQQDLAFAGHFEFIPQDAFLEPTESMATTVETIPFDLWTAIEVQGLIKGTITTQKETAFIELRLFDPFLKQQLVGKRYTATVKDIQGVAHRFADEVMLALTGTRGPFNTKIAYSALSRLKNKEIY